MSKRPADDGSAEVEGGSIGSGEAEKRPKIAAEQDEGSAVGASTNAKPKLYTEEEFEAAVRERLRQETSVPPLLQETFGVNDPVHGFMLLPAVAKRIVDTKYFQRMRYIRQLAMVQYVYPGATHNRFFHSIGTGYLAYEFMKVLRQRQPELRISMRDILCVLIAALCHDLGHPCYSHMFEMFMHDIGNSRRLALAAEGRTPTAAEEKQIRAYETWTHEAASVLLVDMLMEELHDTLVEAGMRRDSEGDDFTCVRELIEPPKEKLEEFLGAGSLHVRWGEVVHGRPVEKAWLYEIVSNWRSGIDVDKFDYFRRDARYLGIHRAFDHERYIMSAKVLPDEGGVPTVSTPEKDKDSLCSNMLELRKTLHLMAYQHKTVKKIELHMTDVLKLMDDHVRIMGSGGRKLKMSEAALCVDSVAYPKLTDTFVESLLFTGADHEPHLAAAAAEYEKRVTYRTLMRMVAIWDMPRIGEEYNAKAGLMPVPKPDALLAGLMEAYYSKSRQAMQSQQPLREVTPAEFKCHASSMHCGMGERDPISRVLFHGKDSNKGSLALQGTEAKTLRRRVFVFWNPQAPADELTLGRLTYAFRDWAMRHVALHEASAKAFSPTRDLTAASPQRHPPTTPVAAGKSPKEPSFPKPRRGLRIQASCPPDPAVLKS